MQRVNYELRIQPGQFIRMLDSWTGQNDEKSVDPDVSSIGIEKALRQVSLFSSYRPAVSLVAMGFS